MRRSTIYDQGKEMAHHLALTENAGLRVYFAHPRSPWERDINENANGLLREYLSKGADLSHFAQQQFADIAYSLNGRPRKSLGWKSPAELFLPEGTFDFVKHYSDKINHVALGASIRPQPRLFRWTKLGDDLLNSLAKCCEKTNH